MVTRTRVPSHPFLIKISGCVCSDWIADRCFNLNFNLFRRIHISCCLTPKLLILLASNLCVQRNRLKPAATVSFLFLIFVLGFFHKEPTNEDGMSSKKRIVGSGNQTRAMWLIRQMSKPLFSTKKLWCRSDVHILVQDLMKLLMWPWPTVKAGNPVKQWLRDPDHWLESRLSQEKNFSNFLIMLFLPKMDPNQG